MYPIGIHFLITQIVGGFLLALFRNRTSGTFNDSYEYAILITGFTGLVTMVPCIYLYKKDHLSRIAWGVIPRKPGATLSWKQEILLLLTGAGLAQYGNMLVGMLQIFIDTSAYQEEMDRITQGKGIWMLIFWMAVVAPVAEEMIFRWLIYLRLRDRFSVSWAAVISALLFGIYHGNIQQFFYASLLGFVFAVILEKSGSLLSCVLLHIGANLWSVLISEYGLVIIDIYGAAVYFLLEMLLLVSMIAGVSYYMVRGKGKERRLV